MFFIHPFLNTIKGTQRCTNQLAQVCLKSCQVKNTRSLRHDDRKFIPFFVGIGGIAQYFAAGVVCVVTVAGNQPFRLAVFDHDVVAVGEAAQFFAAPAVYRGQVAAAVVVVTHHLPSGQRGGAEAVDVQVAVFAAEHSVFRRRIEIEAV